MQFRLKLDPKDDQGLAWGQGLVLLDDEPIWFAEDMHGQDIPVEWTWVDLLEFLGRWWPWLIHEEDYPYPLSPLYPGLLLQEAENRWLDLPDEQVEQEEKEVHSFLARHDLAEAFKGIFLPSLMLLRHGNSCHISAGPRQSRVRTWSEVCKLLEDMGHFLADAVCMSTNPRAQLALDYWNKRDIRGKELELDLTTGLTLEHRNQFQNVDWESKEVRIAARMSSKTVLLTDQQELLRQVGALPRVATPVLDNLASRVRSEFQEEEAPFKQGYLAAGRLRSLLGFTGNEFVDPERILEDWGVLIQNILMENCPVEAVAVWGEMHGPAIILNTCTGSRAAHEHGRRATLAHEIAHLILDRKWALPAGEVLGGRTLEYLEKRARAFAAEFLVPRDAVEEALRNESLLVDAANYLKTRHKVSTELLAWQINNSTASTLLSPEDRTRLEQWKTGRAMLD